MKVSLMIESMDVDYIKIKDMPVYDPNKPSQCGNIEYYHMSEDVMSDCMDQESEVPEVLMFVAQINEYRVSSACLEENWERYKDEWHIFCATCLDSYFSGKEILDANKGCACVASSTLIWGKKVCKKCGKDME